VNYQLEKGIFLVKKQPKKREFLLEMPQKTYLASGIFISGAAVMLIELVGTRIINPIFGSGIYVWSALISITLASLAIGYWIGGIIADKKPVLSTLYFLFLSIGLVMIPVPFISGKIMTECYMLFGSIGGGLCSAMVLFSPSLIMLGMIPPLIIRLRATLVETIGSTSGKLYAISTVGSLAGTLGTGFFLIPAIGNKEIFLSCAGFLLMFSGLGWIVFEKKYGAVAILMIALIVPASAKLTTEKKDGLIFSSQSLYGLVEVVERYGERSLLIDGNTNSHISLRTDIEPIQCEYVRKFSLLPLFRPNSRTGLCIGLGGGLIPQLLAESGIMFDVVDIDPVIPKVARDYFGSLTNEERVFIADGRNFIKTIDRQYDFIVVDAANIDSIPYHLYSNNFFSEAVTKLAPGGIIAMNTMGTVDGGQFESIQATLESVFEHVRAFHAHTTPTSGNAVFFASNSPLSLSAQDEAKFKNDEAKFNGNGIILTDNFNPIDIISADINYDVRKYYRN